MLTLQTTRVYRWLLDAWSRRLRGERAESPEVASEYLRAIFSNFIYSSSVAIALLLYLYSQAPPDLSGVMDLWAEIYMVYLVLRLLAGLSYPRRRQPSAQELRFWNGLSILIQALNGLALGALAIFVYPLFDLYVQSVALMVVLVLVGATAFSLSGQWLALAVYAPPVYGSFAWVIWHQDHTYAQGVAVLVVALFVLHILYAANHRRTLVMGLSLARRNGELADELRLKNGQLQEVATARSRLLATVSHDLRQPAHAIGLLSERAMSDLSRDVLMGTLRDLNELSQSLSASLTTLMDLTRLDAGLVQPRIQAAPLGQLLMRLQAEYGPYARNKGLEFTVEPSDRWVQSDPVLLHAMLANLVSNAIKYTPSGRVSVAVELASDRGQLQLCVRDTGLGIAAEQLDQIFKEFVRLDASESGTEGLGLGLSIVKRYALLLGHRLQVQSQPGQGSEFSVFVPLTLADPTHDASEAGTTQVRLQGARVLVVDNVDLLLSSMVKTLSGWGCQVYAGRSLAEAAEVCRGQMIDVLISDFHLGDREPDGLQLIESLREQAGRRVPALLMTGDVSAQLESSALQQGVQVLHKPVRPNLLRACVIQLLEDSAAATDPRDQP
ncbi:MAG: hybrid sensor histidine kinase/response regulator [Comamonadaceae bacterium]|jgi:signal transduction histidine kinase/CheY-like chemotaxis protein|nr:hybrid sensor histidine kinase/response regulator [Comamonadaceae bacterium]